MTVLYLSVFISWTVIVSAEQLSYVVTSKPYYIQANDNVTKLQRDFNHDSIGENEISETIENGYADCELSNSCGDEDVRVSNFAATFKPFPQDELEKILKKYGKDKISDKISNSKVRPSSSNEISSSLSFQPMATENSFDKSKSWSLLAADNNEEKNPDSERDGWVTLEPVAWSSSQIQKWKPSIQSVNDKGEEIEQEDPPHWKNPIVSKPQFDAQSWNPNKHPWHSSKPSQDSQKPDYEFEKPSNLYNEHKYEPMKHMYESMKPTYDPLKPIYDSLKPTYDPIEPTLESIKGAYDKPTYNPIKPTLDALGLTFNSGKLTYESIKTNLEHNHKPYWNSNQNYENKPSVMKVQPSWNPQVSSDSIPQIITSHNQDQFASYLQQHQQHPTGMFEQNNQLSMLGGSVPGDNDGHWILLSSTREYSSPDRQRNLNFSRSLKSKENFRNSIPLTITAFNPDSQNHKVSRAIDHSDYKNYIPLTSISNSTEYRRRSIPLIITAPGLHKPLAISNRQEKNTESPPHDQKEGSNSRTARRMVRLTVLPPVNGSNIVTSHNGMIEVEDTKLTVDESHREHLARMMKFEQGNRIQRDTTSLPPNKIPLMLPIVIGRRRKRFEPSHVNFYSRKIVTASH